MFTIVACMEPFPRKYDSLLTGFFNWPTALNIDLSRKYARSAQRYYKPFIKLDHNPFWLLKKYNLQGLASSEVEIYLY